MAAVAAAQAQEAVGQDAAFEEGVELVLDESRQVGASLSLTLRDEGRSVLLHRLQLQHVVPVGPRRPQLDALFASQPERFLQPQRQGRVGV